GYWRRGDHPVRVFAPSWHSVFLVGPEAKSRIARPPQRSAEVGGIERIGIEYDVGDVQGSRGRSVNPEFVVSCGRILGSAGPRRQGRRGDADLGYRERIGK